MPTKRKTKKKSTKKKGGIKSFVAAVKRNKTLQSANKALRKAMARKKAAYKKAVAAAKRKFKSKK